jgi:integrase
MARTQVNILEGTHVADSESPSVNVVIEEWQKYIRAEVMAKRLERVTGDHYERIADNHILDDEVGVGIIKLNKLTRPAVNAFRDRLLLRRSEDLTRRVITTLALVSDFAIDRGWATVNNARGIKVRRASRLKAKTSIPSASDVRAIIDNSEEPFRTVLVVAAFCGLRASEIYGLKWDDLDFDTGELCVRRRVDPYGNVGEPKSAAGERTVPLGRYTLNALRHWRLRCGESKGFVFKNQVGKPLDHHNVHARWFKPAFAIRESAGSVIKQIPHFRFHDLRHFAISLWISQGFSPKQVMTFAGHSSITLTFDRYGHLFPEAENFASAMSEAELKVFG